MTDATLALLTVGVLAASGLVAYLLGRADARRDPPRRRKDTPE